MSRWIDADALKTRKKLDGDTCRYYIKMDDVYSAPSIDIVRCGECKWRKAKMMPKSVKCLFSGNADDFCSYGERSSE